MNRGWVIRGWVKYRVEYRVNYRVDYQILGEFLSKKVGHYSAYYSTPNNGPILNIFWIARRGRVIRRSLSGMEIRMTPDVKLRFVNFRRFVGFNFSQLQLLRFVVVMIWSYSLGHLYSVMLTTFSNDNTHMVFIIYRR